MSARAASVARRNLPQKSSSHDRPTLSLDDADRRDDVAGEDRCRAAPEPCTSPLIGRELIGTGDARAAPAPAESATRRCARRSCRASAVGDQLPERLVLEHAGPRLVGRTTRVAPHVGSAPEGVRRRHRWAFVVRADRAAATRHGEGHRRRSATRRRWPNAHTSRRICAGAHDANSAGRWAAGFPLRRERQPLDQDEQQRDQEDRRSRWRRACRR